MSRSILLVALSLCTNISARTDSHVPPAKGGAGTGEDGLLEAWELMKLDLGAGFVLVGDGGP